MITDFLIVLKLIMNLINPNKKTGCAWHILKLASLLLLFSAVTGCKTPQKEWTARLNECGAGSVTATLNKCVFLGSSSGFGPGTVFRKTPDGYDLLYRLSDAETNSDVISNSIVVAGAPNSCNEGQTNQWNFNANLLVSSVAQSNASAGITVSLSRAKSVSYTIKSWSLDTLNVIPFIVSSKQWNPSYIKVLNDPDTLIVTAAYRVSGFSALYEFSPTNAISLQAVYPTNTPLPLSKVLGGTAKASWSGEENNTLKLDVDGNFYVFAALSHFDTNGVLHSGSYRTYDNMPLVPVAASPNATIKLNFVTPQ